MLNSIIIIIVILVSCFFDGWRDTLVDRRSSWWKFHIIKWLAFFPPLIYLILFNSFPIYVILVVILLSSAVWHIGYIMEKYLCLKNTLN